MPMSPLDSPTPSDDPGLSVCGGNEAYAPRGEAITPPPARRAAARTRFFMGGDIPEIVSGASSGRAAARDLAAAVRDGGTTGSASICSIGVASALWLP